MKLVLTNVSDIVELTKPRITLLVLFTTSVGLWLAPGIPSLFAIGAIMIGMAAAVGGVNALNMYLERDIDGRMTRTRNRPLPDGRLEPAIALWFGLALSVSGVALVAIHVNLLSAFLVLVAVATYVLVYTPLKQITTWALPIGAIPGAMPPLIGWTATTGSIDLGALVLFAIIFLWQLPHFHAIGLFRQEEYANAGLKILPVEKDEATTKIHIVIYLGMLLPISLLLYPLGVAGMSYLITALVFGALFLGTGLLGLRKKAGRKWARQLFFVSLIYLTGIYTVLFVTAF